MLLFQVFVCLFSGGEEEDYIKCELIGGGSSRYLNTISNLCIVAVHYTHTATHAICVVAIVGCTHVGSATSSVKDSTYDIW